MMSRLPVQVYAPDRVTILAVVHHETTSIAAARAAGYESVQYERVLGRYSWVAKGKKLEEPKGKSA